MFGLDSFDDFLNFDSIKPDLDIDELGATGELRSLQDQLARFVGDPNAAAGFIEQETGFTCAVASQRMILQQFGIEVSEAQLVYDATSNGWLSDNGTHPDDVGRLLEYYGVSTHANYAGDVEHLIAELAQGRLVIAAVDSGELHNFDPFFEDWFISQGADHALVITGIDFSNPDQPLVIVNDPGHPGGAGNAYPLGRFLEAWADSGQMYVATDESPAGLAESPHVGHQFDQQRGLYMDQEFWTDLATKLAIAVSTTLLSALLKEALPGGVDVTITPGPADYLIENLGDQERNDLFRSI